MSGFVGARNGTDHAYAEELMRSIRDKLASIRAVASKIAFNVMYDGVFVDKDSEGVGRSHINGNQLLDHCSIRRFSNRQCVLFDRPVRSEERRVGKEGRCRGA